LRRITDGWSETGVTWNNQPGSTPNDSVTAKADQINWFTWHPTAILQNIFDNSRNNGFTFQIASESQNNQVLFVSSEATTQNERPVLTLHYDDPPSQPGLDAPANNDVLDYASPTLSVTGKSTDQQSGDTVTTEYQVSKTQGSWSSSNIVADSGSISNGSDWTVPAGVLLDGQQYWWRAIASDGTEQTISAVRAFNVVLPHYGTDERWPMWSDALGNGMQLNVNEASGNLFLSYPLDSVSVPSGDLNLQLTYNSQDPISVGLGRGWLVTAGPGSDPRDLPQSLQVGLDGGHEVELVMWDGTRIAFAKRGGSHSEPAWKATGAMAGTIYQNSDGTTTTYTYESQAGGRYVFTSTGDLQTANPSTTSDGTGGFAYSFGAGGRISSITMPESRTVQFGYDQSNNLSQVQILANGTAIRTWGVAVGTSGLTSVTDPESRQVTFGYAFQADTSTYLTSIQDGRTDATDTWTVGYRDPGNLGASITGPRMQVSSVQAPGTYRQVADDPNSTATLPRTTFAYGAQLVGRVMHDTTVTDPRGNAPGATAADFQTRVQFDTEGFPIQIVGPPETLPGGTTPVYPTTTMVWDTNGNLTCKRLPPANAAQMGCLATGAHGARDTDYDYQAKSPYAITSKTEPAPNPDGSGARASTTYGYDEGIDGLMQESYDSTSFSGLPLDRQVLNGTPVTHDWGSGHPTGITSTGAWAVRWVGRFTTPAQGAYRFRLYAHGTVRLIVAGQVLEDCWSATSKAYTDYNCGTSQNDSLSLSQGHDTFLVEYRHFSGETAKIDLQWDGGNGGAFTSMPGSVFDPNLNLLTSSVNPANLTTTYTYTGADIAHERPTTIDTSAGATDWS
ncbi:MAG: DNRLRE domain-containing protein, partial [Actinoallomurus sp.]